MNELLSTSSEQHAGGLLGSLAGELALRICGTRYDGQVIRVATDKCSIGSGSGCTIRLVAPGVEPLHCLILRGTAGMAIRRWSSNTRLNGRAFTDSQLRVGDRLAIGPIELEIVGDPSPTPLELASQAHVDVLVKDLNESRQLGRNRVRHFINELRQTREQSTHLQSQADEQTTASEDLNSHVEQLQRQLAEMQEERDSIESESATKVDSLNKVVQDLRKEIRDDQRNQQNLAPEWQAQHDRLEGELKERQRKLDEQQKRAECAEAEMVADFQRQREQWETQRKEFEAQLVAANQTALDLEELREQLQATDVTLVETREEADQLREQLDEFERLREQGITWNSSRESELRKAEERLDERAQQLDDATAELNQQRDAFAFKCSEWTEEVLEAEKNLAERYARLKREKDEWTQERERSDEQRRETQAELTQALENLESQWDEFKAASQSTESPIDSASQTLQWSPDLGQQQSVEDSTSDTVDSSANTFACEDDLPQASVDEQANKDDAADESVEDYMARLLKRARCEGGSTEISYSPSTPRANERVEAPSSISPSRLDSQPEEKRENSPAEFRPRSQAPELSTHLKAMRELANESARSAIESSEKRRYNLDFKSNLLVAGFGVFIGSALLCLSNSIFSLTVLGALGSFAFAGYFFVQAANVFKLINDYPAEGQDDSSEPSHESTAAELSDENDGPECELSERVEVEDETDEPNVLA